jgi:hypothetical protein
VSNGFYTSPVAFTSAKDTWTTPPAFYQELAKQFTFTLDAAALASSTLVPANWYGPDHPDPTRRDAFTRNWAADAGGGGDGMAEPAIRPHDWSLDASCRRRG